MPASMVITLGIGAPASKPGFILTGLTVRSVVHVFEYMRGLFKSMYKNNEKGIGRQ